MIGKIDKRRVGTMLVTALLLTGTILAFGINLGSNKNLTATTVTMTPEQLEALATLPLSDPPAWEGVRGIGSIISLEWPQGIAVDAQRNIYVTGEFNGQSTFGSHIINGYNTLGDLFVAKLSPSGTWLWAVSAGGEDYDQANDVAVDNMGAVYICGIIGSTEEVVFGSRTFTLPYPESFVAKLTINGAWSWVEFGGHSNDASSIALDQNKNSYVTGSFTGSAWFGSIHFNAGNNTLTYLARLSPSGAWQWVKTADVNFFDVATDTSSHLYLTGSFLGTKTLGSSTLHSVGEEDVFIAKLTTSGTWLWAHSAGGHLGDSGNAVKTDTQGNSYVTGSYNEAAQFGNTILHSAGKSDVFVMKVSPNGYLQWVRSAGGSDNDSGWDIAVDSSGNSYITAEYSSSTASFGGTILTNSHPDAPEIAIAKLSTSGDWLWAVQAVGESVDYSFAIALDSTRDTFITGFMGGSIAFGTFTLNPPKDMFVARLGA